MGWGGAHIENESTAGNWSVNEVRYQTNIKEILIVISL